jgi:hypothetical protein
MDGSSAQPAPVTLEGVSGPPVLTRVRVAAPGDVTPGSLSASCLQRWSGEEPSDPIVERTAVDTETVTFRDESGHGLYGCDNSQGSRENDRRWCGGAFGRLYSGRLRDPRLELGGCTTRDSRPVGFVWVEPHNDASYVVVEQRGYAEVYRATGGLPVRVAVTNGVEIEESRATIRLSEHDSDGHLVRRYDLEAAVSG